MAPMFLKQEYFKDNIGLDLPSGTSGFSTSSNSSVSRRSLKTISASSCLFSFNSSRALLYSVNACPTCASFVIVGKSSSSLSSLDSSLSAEDTRTIDTKSVLFKRCPHIIAAIVTAMLIIIIILTIILSLNNDPVYT
ncbi:hypothetical protein ALC62_14517 [Cyphomyrmex costatus]|uniref:Uncharacterized protein n=1 Tax=Cyphomyrmex costatus TaxID=456900 RepID=A0A195C269_9HYME|nr:hypothetical protein ALC62_14517 [Cyphomyrmex costatus]